MTRHHAHLDADETIALLNAIEDYAIFLLAPDGEIRSWNSGATQMMGYTADEAIGTNFSRLYTPRDLAVRKPQRELQIAAKTGRVEDESWRLRKDGTRFLANTVITVLRGESGEVTGFAKVTRDLSKRSQADEHLRQSEELFHLLVSSVRDYAIFQLDSEGNVMTWNAGAQRLKGYAPDEIIGRHFSTFYPEADQRNGKPQRLLDTALREGSVEDEGWRVRKDGSVFWADVVITAVYDEQRKLRGFAKVTRDLSHRREAEEQLRQSEEMFRLLVASVGEYAIFLLDPDGNIVTWNAGAQRIKGYRPDEIIGKHFSTFYSEEDRQNGKPQHELEVAKATGSVEDNGWRIRKDGTRFWANVVITAVHDDEGRLRGFAKVTRDMTESKRAEEVRQALFEQREGRLQAEEERRRVEASYHAAQEANRAKDEFLMTLSHELRTPLTSIIGWSRLLPTMEPSDALFGEAVSAIGRSAQVQARLIDDVLDVSRIVSGKLRLQVENINVLELLLDAVDAVRPSADAKHITLVTALSPQLGSIFADATRLQQIVWNLLTNAVKFTPKNGRITIRAERTGSQLQITVSDNGEGIDAKFLPHVFQPFRQAENPSTRIHGGLGLGLSIVRYLVDAHGGTVDAESEGRGKGATFTIALPVNAVAATRPAAESPDITTTPAQPVQRTLTGVSILLIDDDVEGRNVVRAVLRQAGADVTDVESGPQAFEQLDKRLPHLIITDIAMPHMDGYAVAHRIRETRPEMKIIALSAFPPGRSGGKDAVFDLYIPKPVEPHALVESVSRVLGGDTENASTS